MSYSKRCFDSVGALGRRDVQVLRTAFGLFPEFVAEYGLDLIADKLDLEALRDAIMGDRVPEALDDQLYFSSALGSSRGWAMIERQAEEDRLQLPSHDSDLSFADMALAAGTYNWPDNRNLLERANARARIHGKSAFKYYAPANDHRADYRPPTPESVAEAESVLRQHFVAQGYITEGAQERAVRIIPYEYESETWFLCWYADKKRRHRGCEADGEWKYFDFNPEQFDAIVYNKVYGDIRMNTKNQRKSDHIKYRIAIGYMLLDTGSAFLPSKQVVTLAPLQGRNAVDLFEVGDMPGLHSIEPVQIEYSPFGSATTITVRADKGSSLRIANELAPRLVPDGAQVLSAVFQYKLANSSRTSKLTIHCGNRVNYERDGDSLVLESWLRDRRFIISSLEDSGDAAAKEAAA